MEIRSIRQFNKKHMNPRSTKTIPQWKAILFEFHGAQTPSQNIKAREEKKFTPADTAGASRRRQQEPEPGTQEPQPES